MNLDIKNFINNTFNRSKATLIVIGLTALIIFYLNATKTDTEIVGVSEKIWPINAIQAEYKNTTPNLKLFGEIISSRRSDLRVSVGGQVIEVGDNFKEGGVVRMGELLLAIDDFEYQNAVTEGQAKFDILKSDSDRAEALYLRGSVSEQFKDNALLEKTQQEIILAEAKKDLRDTQLFAPYDGVINDVVASLGKQVSTFNDKIGEIIDIKNMEVRFSISKAQYGRLLEDESAIVGRAIEMKWTVGQRDLIFDAYISRVGAEITSNTGGVNIFANIELDTDIVSPTILLNEPVEVSEPLISLSNSTEPVTFNEPVIPNEPDKNSFNCFLFKSAIMN